MSKQEATRLADALDAMSEWSIGPTDALMVDEAVAKLRQWPDGEPVAWQERQAITSTGNWSHWYNCKGRSKSDPLEMVEPNGLHFQWRALYTASPDQSARIAELERQRDALQAEAQIAASVARTNEDALRATLKQAREALHDLLQDTEHATHACADAWCPVRNARAALSAIDKVQP